MASDFPLVSVIIPAFNRADFIEEAVRSVERQNYPDIEVIAFDDGSTDGTYEILSAMAAQGRLELITHPGRMNRGQSAAINCGLRVAKGDFIAILDSDDLFSEDKLVKQVDYLVAHPEVDLVYGRGMAIDGAGRELFLTLGDDHIETGDPGRLLLDCYIALPGGALIRRELFEKVGFFEELFRAGQDHDMALRLFENGTVAFLPETAFFYRKHENSISNNGLETRWKIGFEILRRAEQRYPYPHAVVRKRAAVLNFRLGQVYWNTGRRIAAVPLLIKSFCLDPLRALKVLTGQEKVQ